MRSLAHRQAEGGRYPAVVAEGRRDEQGWRGV